MSRFIVTTMLAGTPVTYLYNDAKHTLEKVQTLLRRGQSVEIRDGENRPMTFEQIQLLTKPKPS